METVDHYAMLLGVTLPWEVTNVDLDLAKQRVDIYIEYTDDKGVCPECKEMCPKHDDRKPRTWRHLDTMQFITELHCQMPRIKCSKHGAKTVGAPWASKGSRFTLLFEGFALRLLQAARSVQEASKLLGLNWHQVEAIKARAVTRGLARREEEIIPYIGIDEKQFRSGHQYISSLVDLSKGRVLDVVENRTEEACRILINTALTEFQKDNVTAVAVDMWKAYSNAIEGLLPSADIVHDRFHISQHLNNAVDIVRRQENKKLAISGNMSLKGSKFLWLANEDNVPEKHQSRFAQLKYSGLKVARAWAIKEQFRGFWDYSYAGSAKKFYDAWYAWAIRSRLAPIKKEARMIKSHLANILTYFKHRISNATSEGLNSKIQTIKSNARGYRSFDGFRNSILFYCGKLDLTVGAPH